MKTNEMMKKHKKAEEMVKYHIPIELVENIILRLPVKSLLIFKCVSKDWCNLINTPEFTKLHLNRSLSNPNFHLLVGCDHHETNMFHTIDLNTLVAKDNPKNKRLEYKALPIPDLVRVDIPVGSCNGIVCLRDSSGRSFTLYNPSTRTHRKLPDDDNASDFAAQVDINRWGFGHDSVRDEYKVIRIVPGERSATLVVCNCSGDRRWYRREIIEDITLFRDRSWDICPLNSTAKQCNNRLHWVSNYKIGSIDLNTERVESIPYPDLVLLLRYEYHWPELGTDRGGSLLILTYCLDTLDVWMMKEYGVKESWSKIWVLNRPEIDPVSTPYTCGDIVIYVNVPFISLRNICITGQTRSRLFSTGFRHRYCDLPSSSKRDLVPILPFRFRSRKHT